MAQVATKVVTNNVLSSKVKVVDKRSTELLVGKGLFALKIEENEHLFLSP